MIAGISIIIDPNARHAGQMREIVKSFMDHFGNGFDLKSDGFSKKEAAIVSIRTLRNHLRARFAYCWFAPKALLYRTKRKLT